jgi:accessory gene regulator protein AgrB
MEYALDLILFNGSLLLIGAFTKNFINSVFFIITMAPLKMIAGGAHAKSQGVCSIISYSVFILTMAISQIATNVKLSLFNLPYISYILCALTVAICVGIIFLAPVDHPNKRFDNASKKKLKKISFFYCIAICMLQMFMLQYSQTFTNISKPHAYRYSFTVFTCLIVIFVNQIIGKIIDRKI